MIKHWQEVHYTAQTNIEPTGDASIVYKDHILYIFGGENSKLVTNNSLFAFNITTNTLSLIQTKGMIPSPRLCHTACVYKEMMIIFGGALHTDGPFLNDLYFYHFNTNYWEKVDIPGGPSKRYQHIACIWKHKMYIFGGGDETGYFNDFYELDLDLRKWKSIPNRIIPPRWNHSACICKDVLYIFGGRNSIRLGDMYYYDLNKKIFGVVNQIGEVPRRRTGFIMDSIGDSIYLFGGFDELYFNDLYKFDINSQKWEKLKSTNTPFSRRNHASAVVGGKWYVFGGQGITYFNDIHEIELEIDPIRQRLLESFQKWKYYDVIFKFT